MAKLKLKLSSLAKSLLKLCRKTLHYALPVVFVYLAGWFIMNSEQIHRYYLRASVGPKVVEMVKVDESGEILGGGTGFLVKAPSGQTYLLTNSHICAMSKDGSIMVQLPEGGMMPRKIIRDSDETDLCLLEGIPGRSGLSLADDYNVGEILAAVGHPHLMPLTVSKGEIIGRDEVELLAGVISVPFPIDDPSKLMKEEDCSKPKNEIVEADTLFGHIKVCMNKIRALQTNVVGLPGNSGSPVVNSAGDVVGVLFAGDQDVHWSMIVPLEDIRHFLKPY